MRTKKPAPTLTEPVEILTEPELPFAPPDGWMPEAFPSLTVAPIPYTSNPQVRTDPYIQIVPDGWMFIEVGNVRIAIPDEEEWNKLVYMGQALWNTHNKAVAEQQAAIKAAAESEAEVEEVIDVGVPTL